MSDGGEMAKPVSLQSNDPRPDALTKRIDKYVSTAKDGRLKSRLPDDFFNGLEIYLKDTQNPAWSAIPRTYFLLRVLDRTDLMNAFIAHKILDTSLPYSKERFPDFIRDKHVRDRFLERQALVLETMPLNLFASTKHRHIDPAFDEHTVIVPGQRLASGGQGDVDVIRVKHDWREYARKLIRRPRTFARDKAVIEVFHNEVHNLRRLSHHHLVSFVGSYTDVDFLAIITEPVADGNLTQYFDEIVKGDFQPEKLTHLRSLFGCMASAVTYIHEQSCRHKDIKPANILLKSGMVLLTDFGIALDTTDLESDETNHTRPAYTTAYAAPELLEHSSRGYPADIFALGCTFLEMMVSVPSCMSRADLSHRLY